MLYMVDWIVPALSALGALGGALGGQWIAAKATRARAEEQRAHDNAAYWRAQRASFYKDLLEVVADYSETLRDLVSAAENGERIDGNAVKDFEKFRRRFSEIERMVPLFSRGEVVDACHLFKPHITIVDVVLNNPVRLGDSWDPEVLSKSRDEFYNGFRSLRQAVREELGVA